MLDKINGKKSSVRIIGPLSFISQGQIDRIWKSVEPKINIEIQFPLIFGEPYYQPEFFDPRYNSGNNPKNNSYASGFCNCSLPSKNITY